MDSFVCCFVRIAKLIKHAMVRMGNFILLSSFLQYLPDQHGSLVSTVWKLEQ